MGRANVYLPDDLERRVKAAGIPISEVCQRALLAAVESAKQPDSGLVHTVGEQFDQGWRAGTDWANSTTAEAQLTLLRDQRLDEIPATALPDDLYGLTREQTLAWEAGFVEAARTAVRAALPARPVDAAPAEDRAGQAGPAGAEADPGPEAPADSERVGTTVLGDDSDCHIGVTLDDDPVCFDPHFAVRASKSPVFAILGAAELRAKLTLSIAQDAAARGSAVLLVDLSGQLTPHATGLGKTVRVARRGQPPVPPLEDLLGGAMGLGGLFESLSRLAPAGGFAELFSSPSEDLLEPGYVSVLSAAGDGPLASALTLAQAAQALSRLRTPAEHPRLLHIDLPGGVTIPGGLTGRLSQIIRAAREHDAALGLSAESADTVAQLGGRGAMLSTVFAFATSNPVEADRLRGLLGANAPILLNAPGATVDPGDQTWAVMRDLAGRLGQVRIDH